MTVKSTVAIFRKRLLSYSETFIADQGNMLPGYRALFCGFNTDRSGIHLLEANAPLLLEDYAFLPGLAKFMLRRGFGGGRTWLQAIGSQAPNLLHAHFFNDGLDAVRIGGRLGLPVVTTLHGHDITKHENAPASSRVNREFFARVDRVIAVSNFIAIQALARGCPESKLVQHYIGIDLDRFTRQKNESDEPSLLFVGRLVEKKGCTYLLQAMELLQSRFPGLQLTIIGEGELRLELQREARSRGLNVDFLGAASADVIREHMARSWIFVAPSITAENGDTEGLGMVFLEAQALQTPVVSFRSGGLVEAVDEGRTALLCAEKDIVALAANIGDLLDNRALRHNMGIEGRKRVEQGFDIRKQCARLETIYAECI